LGGWQATLKVNAPRSISRDSEWKIFWRPNNWHIPKALELENRNQGQRRRKCTVLYTSVLIHLKYSYLFTLFFAENPPVRTTCSYLYPPVNGRYIEPQQSITTWFANDEAVFVCDHGFDMSGSSTSRCMPTGSWSNDVPSCQPQIRKSHALILSKRFI